MSRAVYAGTFDPVTNGHLDVIQAGLVAFDRLFVAVLADPPRETLFTVEERVALIEAAVDDPRVEVGRFERGLLVEYAGAREARVILRGLRAAGDFERELQMANLNRHLGPGIETMFVMTGPYAFVSSRLVKEVAALGGNLDGIVPAGVAAALRERFPG